MNLGAEPKKLAALGVLVVVAIGGLYFNSSSDTPSASSSPRAPVAAPSGASPLAKSTARVAGRPASTDFHPRVLGSRPDDKVDVSTIDPELRLDLLAKVEAVEPINAGRNLFQFGQAPPPPKPLAPVPSNVPKIPISQLKTPPPSQTAKAGPPPPPPAQPINLKYYGYIVSKVDGRKQAFLLDGDDILMVGENQTVKQRYRVVKIALTTIDIEDIQAKNTQTLRLPPDAPS